MSRIERGDGVSLYVARVGLRWHWWLSETGTWPSVGGRAWTRRKAIAHGRIARALRVAGRRQS